MTKKREKQPGERFTFTSQWLEGVPTPILRDGRKVARDEYRDDQVPFLRLSVTSSGKKHFVLYRRYNGGPSRRDIIGTYPRVSLDVARNTAREWNRLADLGIDHKIEDARIKAEADAERLRVARESASQIPFVKVAEDFIADMEGKRRVRDEAEIRRHIIPRLGAYPITNINSGHLILLANAFKKQKATGRLLVSHAKRISSYALHQFVEDESGEPVNKYGLDVDPFAGVKQKKLFGQKIPRDRTLTDDEIAAAWAALDKLDEPASKAVKLMFYTGLRVEDASTLLWESVDLKERTITLTRDEFKSHVKFKIPLVDGAVTLLRSIKRGKGPYVFSARGKDGVKHINGWGPYFKKLRGELGDQKTTWSSHDIRRTVRTSFSRLRVDFEVKELALGHIKKALIATYDVWDFYQERREAFEKWETLLHSIVAPPTSATVTRLKRVG